jgi:hypothetical protein
MPRLRTDPFASAEDASRAQREGPNATQDMPGNTRRGPLQTLT